MVKIFSSRADADIEHGSWAQSSRRPAEQSLFSVFEIA
jgi:hypothetical protein